VMEKKTHYQNETVNGYLNDSLQKEKKVKEQLPNNISDKLKLHYNIQMENFVGKGHFGSVYKAKWNVRIFLYFLKTPTYI
jgi:hypothetical protein